MAFLLLILMRKHTLVEKHNIPSSDAHFERWQEFWPFRERSQSQRTLKP
jgi:hypothetical protein